MILPHLMNSSLYFDQKCILEHQMGMLLYKKSNRLVLFLFFYRSRNRYRAAYFGGFTISYPIQRNTNIKDT